MLIFPHCSVSDRRTEIAALDFSARAESEASQLYCVQPHGVLIALNAIDLTIVQISTNCVSLLGRSPQSLLGQNLNILFAEPELRVIRHLTLERHLHYGNPLRLSYGQDPETPKFFQGILHRSMDDQLILEIEPLLMDSGTGDQTYPFGFYELVQDIIYRIQDSQGFEETSQVLATEIHRLIRFDRVMIYRFKEDKSGVVIAESKEPHLPSYLNLHYPAFDIPETARSFFSRRWVRQIVDVEAETATLIPEINPLTQKPLDISRSILRGVSPCHLQYLKNMGVAASLTVSLINDRELWGLIACHHHEPKPLNHAERQACEFLGQFMSIHLFQRYQQDLRQYQEQVQHIQEEISYQLQTSYKTDLNSVFQPVQDHLLSLIQAPGAIVVLQNDRIEVGRLPEAWVVEDILNWLEGQCILENVWYTDYLAELHPPARDYADQVSGLMVLSLEVSNEIYRLIWFRPEVVKNVHWAGEPDSAWITDHTGKRLLCPRQSFALWKETVQYRSLPWLSLEIKIVQELRHILLLTALRFSETALEEAVQEARSSNRLKSEFLANISHEIRTPMNAILGFSQLLNGMVQDPTQKSYLNSVISGGQALLSLINDILDLSKMESGKFSLQYEPCNVTELLQNIQQIFWQKAQEKGLAIYLEIPHNFPIYITIDPLRLRQILLNIVGNALKFTHQGQIIIRAFCQSTMPENPSVGNADQATIDLIIEVEDSGIGIAPDQKRRIFEAFVQSDGQNNRQYGGTGLGLAITQRLTEMMNGTIELTSQLNQGSCFRFLFPGLSQVPINSSLNLPLPIPTIPVENFNRFQHLKILVVDEALSNRKMIEEYFIGSHHHILLADSGKDGLQLAKTQSPDLIFLDLWLSDISGATVAKMLRQDSQTQHIAIVMITGSLQHIEEEKDLLSFCEGYLLKPVTRSQVIAVLESIFL